MKIKKFLFFVLILFSGISIVSAIDLTLSCGWTDGACQAGYSLLFAVPSDSSFRDSANEPLSCNIQTNMSASYNKALCCKSALGGSFSFHMIPFSSSCTSQQKEVLYFTNWTNGRVAIPNADYSSLINYYTPEPFKPEYYNSKLCVDLSQEYASMDLVHTSSISEALNYERLGYTCLFRTSSPANGLVSSCDAKFTNSSGDQSNYEYAVWARLWENTDSLKCNLDCTSKLDNRVYSQCSTKIEACRGVPSACDGSLYGSYVDYDIDSEIQCSAPWNKIRSKTVGTGISVEADASCKNLVDVEYQVLINNEFVTMHIYICSN